MNSEEKLVRVGQIVGAFGIKGQVKVLPLTDFAERFDVGRRLMAKGQWLTVKDQLIHGTQLVLTFDEVADRTTAETLQWTYLDAPESERPELDEDEYLTRDLIGLKVVLSSGEAIGTLKDVMTAPAHDVFIVKLDKPTEEITEALIPVVHEFVKSVDLKKQLITIEVIDGMLPE